MGNDMKLSIQKIINTFQKHLIPRRVRGVVKNRIKFLTFIINNIKLISLGATPHLQYLVQMGHTKVIRGVRAVCERHTLETVVDRH